MVKSRESYRLGAAASRFVSELTVGGLVGLPFVKKMSQMVLMIDAWSKGLFKSEFGEICEPGLMNGETTIVGTRHP